MAVLDIGCGSHSAAITRRYLKDVTYTGADVTRDYEADASDKQYMDHFVLVGYDGSGYEAIPDASFDAVILNHVLEHMSDPLPVLAAVCRKLRPGGYIYAAFPSIRSLALPSASGSTLNFCDDETHIRIVSVQEVAQVLLDHGVRIIRAGRSHDPIRYLIGAALYPWRMLTRAVTGRMTGNGLWYFLGFEDMVLGQRRS